MAAGQGRQDRQQRLLQLIECPICLNEQQDPRLLSCRHIYCHKCLKDYHEKGNHGNTLPCPQCREVTTLYEDGVNNLPKFFFMNELKEVVMSKDGEKEDANPPKHGGVVCSTEDCGQSALKYCKQCEFLCQQCYNDHSKGRVTKSHQVIAADEVEAFTKSKVPRYPPCHRHEHQVMDLYCLRCHQPMCNTCSNSIHDGHRRCELAKHAEKCKIKLEQICEDTDSLIHVVKQAIKQTETQLKQAETDIDGACDSVRSTFKMIHETLVEEEKKLLISLQQSRTYVKKTCDATIDSQSMSLADLDDLKSCQTKLTDKDSVYDYATVTVSIQKDVEDHLSKELPGIMWNSQIVRKATSSELCHQRRVDLSQSEVIENVKLIGSKASDEQVEVKEVSRIRLHAQDKGDVWGIVVHHQHVYVVHDTGLVVYCYTPDGSFSHKYEHKGGGSVAVTGMCLVMEGDTGVLVVSDFTNKALVWVRIHHDGTMEHHHTLHLTYHPRGACNDRGGLIVCDARNKRLHRYKHDGEKGVVINLPDDVIPWWAVRHGDSDDYLVSDCINKQVVVFNGYTKMRYRDEIHGVKMGLPSNVATLPNTSVLISDIRLHQVLLLRSTGDVVKILDEHVRSPHMMYVDTDYHRLYVSGTDQHDVHHVFVFNSRLLSCDKQLTMKITKLNMNITV